MPEFVHEVTFDSKLEVLPPHFTDGEKDTDEVLNEG